MMRLAFICAIAALSACSSPDEMGEDIAKGSGATALDELERRVAAGAKPREIVSETPELEFRYAWPAQAAAIGPLDAILARRADEAAFRLERNAARAIADAEEFGYPYLRYSEETDWQVSADTPRLLALVASAYAFSGGAHGNTDFDALVWDRRSEREEPMDTLALFADVPALEAALRTPYCGALRDLRIERAGGDVDPAALEGCPSLGELTVTLGTSDGKVVDRLVLLAAPYVVGAYAEGAYEVEVPLNAAMLAQVKPAYRSEFALAD